MLSPIILKPYENNQSHKYSYNITLIYYQHTKTKEQGPNTCNTMKRRESQIPLKEHIYHENKAQTQRTQGVEQKT